jgi:hypothetical protein
MVAFAKEALGLMKDVLKARRNYDGGIVGERLED